MQERTIQRLGAKNSQSVQVRIVAATNQSLEKDVEQNKFRSDLFFRLKEFAIKMPSLRERKEDIPYLAKRFMDEVQVELNKSCKGFSKPALQAIIDYPWPGNVRELRNVIRQAGLLSDEEDYIHPEHLIFSNHVIDTINVQEEPFQFLGQLKNEIKPLRNTIKVFTEALEKKIIKNAIELTGGNKSDAARRLEVDYKTLLRKLKNHQIE